MNNHDFITLAVSNGTAMDAYIALPGEDRGPAGIILLQEAFGVNHHIRNIAERLCSANRLK
jgi:carboxymethylenebutenolidase